MTQELADLRASILEERLTVNEALTDLPGGINWKEGQS